MKQPTGPLAADLLGLRNDAKRLAKEQLNVERLTDEVDNAVNTGQIDMFNPHRPWCEALRYAIMYAVENTDEVHTAADLVSEWLELQMQD